MTEIRRSSRAQPPDEVLSPEWIRALRLRLGYTTAKFARLIGVSLRTVTYWESGFNAVSNRAAASALLDVGAVWLPMWPLLQPVEAVRNLAWEEPSRGGQRRRRTPRKEE